MKMLKIINTSFCYLITEILYLQFYIKVLCYFFNGIKQLLVAHISSHFLKNILRTYNVLKSFK